MTYGTMKKVLEGLLTGDTDMPRDDEVMKALLGMAFDHIVSECQVLSLMTLDKSEDISRIAVGEYLMRVPKLPETDEDELDVDDTIGYVAASYIADVISDKDKQKHLNRMTIGIKRYNDKVTEFIETLQEQEDGTWKINKAGN